MLRQLLLHGDWQLAVGPSSGLGVPPIIIGGSLSLRGGLLPLLLPTVDDLLSEHCPILFPLLREFLIGQLLGWLLFELTLDAGDGGLRVSIVLRIDLLSRLLENPIVLIVVVMAPLVHKILENFPHVVVIWSLLKLEVPTIIEIGVELFRQSSG